VIVWRPITERGGPDSVTRIAVVLNPAAGKGEAGDARDRIERLLAGPARTVTVHVIDNGPSARRAAQDAIAQGSDILVAGGGDGTLSMVAQNVVGSSRTLGVLPLGTRNHFARDLGIPLDLEAAAAVVLAGKVQSVDVGEVGGRVFLNNSSLGVYPTIVGMRTRLQRRGVAKWLAALWATLVVLRRRPFLGLRIQTVEQTLLRRTPFVLVGNNEYRMSGLQAASRDSLSTGKLAVYVMRADRRRGLLLLAWRVAFQGAGEVDELELLRVEAATVETKRERIRVALDGELVELASPLYYRARPGALRVLVP
jgi:diacylglycerol kinase family enzyme